MTKIVKQRVKPNPVSTRRATELVSAAEPKPAPTTRKGKLRRQLLKDSMAELLQTVSYHDLTLDQITRNADIPISVFYHYFNSKRELALELLEEVFQEFRHKVHLGKPYGTFENGIKAANLELLRLYEKNTGLIRCLNEVEDPEFAMRWRQIIGKWRKQVAGNLAEFADPPNDNKDELLAIIYALGGMTESFAQELLVFENAQLKSYFPTLEEASSFISALSIRALFLNHPVDKLSQQFNTLKNLKERDTRMNSGKRGAKR
jgi:AcrR family transcriptional regulator